MRVLTVFGTRPEAIKLAPVLRELSGRPGEIESISCVTAQHRQMLDQVLDFFGLRPDFDLDLMRDNQTLSSLTAAILEFMDPVLQEVNPDWVVVQGDTTTCMVVALQAYYRKIRVGHVEAGLRTQDKYSPFPEELNRRLVAQIADLHFCPTEKAREHLLLESVPKEAIHVTGNTIVDALLWARDTVEAAAPGIEKSLMELTKGRKVILVTGHRRESFGAGFEQICLALKDLSRMHGESLIIYPVHLNPNVRNTVLNLLSDQKNILLLEPLNYADFIWLMVQAHIVLTDSGGVQEEAPSLGKPVLVMREKTERTEGIAAGTAMLVGTDRERIVQSVDNLMSDEVLYSRMALAKNPYGDGFAATRIVDSLLQFR
ncbi:UDP-N-acetylglucosamine 2-epimerase (non-hydrolyzing) [bacterium]|nr:UDP-N-acetylglucosamine 2-epimerase (non-hydrolyzing) [bacterium]